MRDGLIAAAPEPDAEVLDLRGRCVLPGFTDSHVHFPTWSLGLRQARLEGARSLEEALDRVVAARPNVPEGGWLRGLGWREGDWTEAPTREALDRAVSDVPVALMSKDYHSLWLNSAALERADAPLEVPGGVSRAERDPARERGVVVPRPLRPPLRGRDDRRSARGHARRGVTGRRGDPRQGRLAGRIRGLRAAARGGRAGRARLAVVPVGPARRPARARAAVGLRQRHAPDGLPQGLHGRHARLRDGAPARRLRGRDQLARGARGRGAARRRGGLAGRRARDRRRRQPRRARRVRGHA